MRIAICDDERDICELIRRLVEKYKRENKEQFDIQVFYSGEDLVEYMKDGNQVDLLFLDICFSNGMNGVDVGHIIRNQLDDQLLKLVYVSGWDEYDRQLFDYQPMNFIEKPINENKVLEAIARAKRLLDISETAFYYPKRYGQGYVKYRDIMYFESQGRHVEIHLCDQTIEYCGKIKTVAEKVCDKGFIQIHRSYIVNYDYISQVEYERIFLTNSKELTIGETFVKQVHEKLTEWGMED